MNRKAAMGDAVVMLVDGRMLVYTGLSEPAGPVVMYFHGAPASGLDLVWYDDHFVRAGIRVVSADRPGYGRSSPQPGRMREWPVDVAALAGHLGVGQFVVIGLSAGGLYAVACAALLPGRVGRAGVLNGVTDIGWAPAWDGYGPADAALMRTGDEAGRRSGWRIATAACREVRPDDHAVVLKVWSKRHRDLGRLHTQVACRLCTHVACRGEFLEIRPLILAPICTGIPFKVGLLAG